MVRKEWNLLSMIIWSVAGGVSILVFFLILFQVRFQREVRQSGPADLVQFVRDNESSKRAALFIRYNGKVIASVNPSVKMPLASTVKIIVAIEYARQAADGRIDPEQPVSLDALRSFYVPKTDGGAHEAWLSHVQAMYGNDSVPLSEVASGMIAYSSNANTEYLLQLLGINNVNDVLSLFGLTDHEPVYPLVSTLFVPARLITENEWTKKQTAQRIEQMKLAEYRHCSIDIHEHWPPSHQEIKHMYRMMNMTFQKLWSDRLPRSTVEEYASVMAKLNSKSFLSKEVHAYLDPVLEQIMKEPANQQWLLHAGKKGGSTAFVLTEAMYATAKEGGHMELAFFSDGLTVLEQAKLLRALNTFERELLQNESYRQKIKDLFSG